MTSKDRLIRAGKALYGAEWKTKLAEALQINRQTPQRWASGHTPLQADHPVWAEIEVMLRAHAQHCLALADEAEISRRHSSHQASSQ